jgi:hypothetical protein
MMKYAVILAAGVTASISMASVSYADVSTDPKTGGGLLASSSVASDSPSNDDSIGGTANVGSDDDAEQSTLDLLFYQKGLQPQ